ncbi:MAG: heme-copper oxidase subunit III [Actinomycetota bacterium]
MTARAAATNRAQQGEKLRAPVLGMVLFIASEVMFFGALFGAYYTLRADAARWPPPGTPELELVRPLVLTAVLLSSSATQHLALRAARGGNRASTIRWLSTTVLLGAAFIVEEGYEWAVFISDGFTVATNIFGTLFFTMTGFHGLHLLAGLAILLLALTHSVRASRPARGLGSLEAATLYWHFVDGVWLFLLFTLYVLNVVDGA